MLEDVPVEALKILAASEPAFQSGGFRMTKPETLRARAVQFATSAADMPDTMRRMLTRHASGIAVVALLSERVVIARHDELAAVFGHGRIALACWLDEREAIRKAAEEWLAKSPVFAPLDAEEAAKNLRTQFARVLEALTDADATGEPRSRDAWLEERRKMKEETTRLHEENRRLKGVDDRYARQRERAEKTEAALATTLREKKDAEADARRATQEREEAREELARDKKFREVRLLALHEAGMAKAFEGWLDRARAVEAETQTKSDVLERAETALANQAAAERHSGNRATLQARLHAVEEMRERVAAALNDAIRPSAALLAAARELQNEAQRLASLLAAEQIPATPFEHAFALHAHKADETALYHLITLLDRVEEMAALEPAAVTRLRGVLATRQALLHATAGDPENVEETNASVALLRRALLGKKGLFLLIDGHNVFFALQGKYAAPTGPVVPDREKRARFVADVLRVVRPRPTCRAWIVFDGPTYSEESPASNVRVIYSGGTGEHRADKVLAETVRFFRSAEPEVPVIVVTNDNGLRGETQKLGALSLSAAELGTFL